MALLHKYLCEDDKFTAKLCSTGQHKELVSDVLQNFKIKADFEFEAMDYNSSMAAQMAYMLGALQKLVEEEMPHLIIVQGDTLTAYCGSQIAFLNKIKLVHVEAGLRTYNKWGPFPEDINRRYIDMVADLHCAPTHSAKENLISENVKPESIIITGNTGIDALKYISNSITQGTLNVDEKLKNEIDALTSDGISVGLLTLHRRESTIETMLQMLQNIESAAEDNSLVIYFPMHPNPKFQAIIEEFKDSNIIRCIDALSYNIFVWIMNASNIILTDSGGIQEEAPALGKPLIILRQETERVELLDHSFCKLYNPNTISSDIKHLLNQKSKPIEIYGDGMACQKIIDGIKRITSF